MDFGFASHRQGPELLEVQELQEHRRWFGDGQLHVEEVVNSDSEGSGCHPACSGFQAVCYEKKTKRDLGWRHVGEGNGSYKQVEEFSYVGKGVGNYELERSDPRRLLCLGLFAALSCAIAVAGVWVVLGKTPVSHSAVRTMSDVPTSHSLLQEERNFDCSSHFRAQGWTRERRDYCCRNFGLACMPSGEKETPLLTAADCGTNIEAWSFDQKAWCCANTGQGCGEEQ